MFFFLEASSNQQYNVLIPKSYAFSAIVFEV